jgi:hypothetical protein
LTKLENNAILIEKYRGKRVSEREGDEGGIKERQREIE